MAHSKKAHVYICDGSACRKHKRDNKALCKELGAVAGVENVRCQKICKGPVVGCSVSGSLEWFRKLEPKRDLAHLLDLVAGEQLPKPLSPKRAKKRSGKLR